jgi:hypothetical protein
MLRRDPVPSEVELRRAVSTAYYGLFHTFTQAASKLVAPHDVVLQSQVARAYNHVTVRAVCETVWRGRSGGFKPPFDKLFATPPDEKLVEASRILVKLYAARVTADYELAEPFSDTFAFERVQSAQSAATAFTNVVQLPSTQVFLTALLLADRWTRRG